MPKYLVEASYTPEGLRGLARSYLVSGRPELAGQPLATAVQATPNDPKLLQLVGVADSARGGTRELGRAIPRQCRCVR